MISTTAAAQEDPKTPTVELPPLESVDSSDNKENISQQTPSKQPKLLMGENETSTKKSPVKFDETRNVVKEFAKNEKIINFKAPKKQEELKPNKIAKLEETPKVAANEPEPAPKPETKSVQLEKQIQKL